MPSFQKEVKVMAQCLHKHAHMNSFSRYHESHARQFTAGEKFDPFPNIL